MKLRVIAGLLLLLVTAGLPIAAMSKDGPPWGFRGHQAVVLYAVGTVEATASEARQRREGKDDEGGKLTVAHNTRFDAGDEVRVARLAQVQLRMPTADVTVGDGARVIVTDGGVRLARGALEVALQDVGGRGFTVELDEGGAILVRGPRAKARLLADGKGTVTATVTDGTLTVRGEHLATNNDVLVEPGKKLVVRDKTAVVVDKPQAIEVTATCSGGKLNVIAPAYAQVFAASMLSYPDVAKDADAGSVVLDVEPTKEALPVLVRDVFGLIAQTHVVCESKKR